MMQQTQTERKPFRACLPESELSEKSDAQSQEVVPSILSNRALQRLLAQRAAAADPNAPFTLDDDTEARINGERGNGMSLDTAIQAKMGAATGHDFSGVRVHTSPESHALNEQLSAKAFTTGQDIFFRAGEYNPGSSGGQELLAHELTHVVQQGTGRVGGGSGGGMTVNAPGDAFEQEADAMSKHVTSSPASGEAAGLQRAEMPEEEELQTKALQRADAPPEEEELQMQAMPEEEEEVQMQEMPEEEEMPA
jgi:hypothetical protein